MVSKQSAGNNRLAMTLLKGRTFIVLVILLIFFSITANNFLSAGALLTVAKHVALYGILAIGMTYVIITGGIDLSVGSIAGLAGMLA
ncbi:MAG TPA: sugar ABC transporter permease, partial [Lachnospiraceae bacterium]|nr:sugar ABC transporter permease [Lachnospiraceae bacterium]